MEQSDARPPPGVCGRIAKVLDENPEAANLAELRDKSPFDFALLQYHAGRCLICRQAIEQAFPDGFVTEEEARQLDDGLLDAEQLLIRDTAERDSSRNTPETGKPGSEPRGGG